MDAVQALESIQSQAEEIRNNETQRFPEAASHLDYWRQGDIYINYLDELPKGAKQVDLVKQLAPGTTQGSRHILEGGEVEMYSVSGDALTGPVLRVIRETTVTHPEHADVILPEGVYSITYQRAHDEVVRRVLD